MKYVLVTLLLGIPILLNAQMKDVKEPSQLLAKGSITTFIHDYTCDIFLSLVNGKISSFHIQESDSDDPFSGKFFLKDIGAMYEDNQVHFSTRKVKKLLRVYISPRFSPIEGGELCLYIYQNGEWKKEYLYILKNSKGMFKLFSKNIGEKKIVFEEIEVVTVSLKIRWNLRVAVDHYEFN